MKKFIAFISYSRKDKDVADWLHRRLESYEIPQAVRSTTPLELEGKYLRKVFIDRQDLHVEERPFTDGIQTALEYSQFLIVLCSKNSAKSEFVDREIRYFLATHENNYSRIIPLFIDDVDQSIPPAFQGTSIMTRHFPIYNTRLSKDSEANIYSLYQVVSYMLGADFADIYNRYEARAAQTQRAKRQRFAAMALFMTLVAIGMGAYHYFYYTEKQKVIEHQQRLIDFERKVFPAAVVHGYEQNFLTPVIQYLKTTGEKFTIYVLMPCNERDLTHKYRIIDIVYDAKMCLGVDSIQNVLLPTDTQGGSRVMRMVKEGEVIDGVYLDLATTTTSFLDIAKYKKRHPEYRKVPLDSIISEYSIEFVSKTKEELKDDSIHVAFFTDRGKMLEAIKRQTEL